MSPDINAQTLNTKCVLSEHRTSIVLYIDGFACSDAQCTATDALPATFSLVATHVRPAS